MSKLPEKELLTGAKIPKTTTGEMKSALGKLRDYLGRTFRGRQFGPKRLPEKRLALTCQYW